MGWRLTFDLLLFEPGRSTTGDGHLGCGLLPHMQTHGTSMTVSGSPSRNWLVVSFAPEINLPGLVFGQGHREQSRTVAAWGEGDI